jgi:5-methyltetrahydrofolate--homocysteine methyltransferase
LHAGNVKSYFEKERQAKGIYGIFPANQVNDDDIELTPQLPKVELKAGVSNFKTASPKDKGAPNIALSDFIAPKILERQIIWVLFCVTTFGVDEWAAEFEKDLDDYNSIMVKALADRRSFCRIFTRKVRKEIWGYAADEVLSTDDMIAETYKGIRPAPGYPLS